MSCEECSFAWAVRLPTGEIVEVKSGHLKSLNLETSTYDDPFVKPVSLGYFLEYLGGRLGQLPQCIREVVPEHEYVDVLIEGRWQRIRIR